MSCRKNGFFSPHIQWYYQHVHIAQMWEDEERLVFQAELPLVTDTTYLRYSVKSWPMAGNTSAYTLQVQVPDTITLDTHQGGIFVPHSSLGNRPSICRTGPIYGVDRFLCARSLLNRDIARVAKSPLIVWIVPKEQRKRCLRLFLL